MKPKIITILIIAIYLSGCFTSYKYIRLTTIKQWGSWTINDRNSAVALSIGSWLSVGLTWLVLDNHPSNNAPAKW